MKHLRWIIPLLVATYIGGVNVYAQVGGALASRADFTCPTQTAGGWATASYAAAATSTPGTGLYANRQCFWVSNTGSRNVRVGDVAVVSATQGIVIPAAPLAAGSPAVNPVQICVGGSALWCAGGGTINVTDQNFQ